MASRSEANGRQGFVSAVCCIGWGIGGLVAACFHHAPCADGDEGQDYSSGMDYLCQTGETLVRHGDDVRLFDSACEVTDLF